MEKIAAYKLSNGEIVESLHEAEKIELEYIIKDSLYSLLGSNADEMVELIYEYRNQIRDILSSKI